MVNILTHWNGFVQRKRAAPLATGDLALYYVLMEHWNALGRPEWLSVAAGVLQADSGLSDTTFKRARQRLCRKGYINYRQGAGRSAARYHLVDMGPLCGRGWLAKQTPEPDAQEREARLAAAGGVHKGPSLALARSAGTGEYGAAVPPRVAGHPSPHTVSATNGSGNRCDGFYAQECEPTGEAGTVGVGGGCAAEPGFAAGKTGEPAPCECEPTGEAGTVGVGGAEGGLRSCRAPSEAKQDGPLGGSRENGKAEPVLPSDGRGPQAAARRDAPSGKDPLAREVAHKMAHKVAHKVDGKVDGKVAPLYKEKDKEKEKEDQHPLAGMLETVEWQNYAQMRLRMKRPLAPGAVHIALDKLLALAPGNTATQRRILDQSTFYCWKDLYPLERRAAQDGARAAQAGQAAQERMAGVDINELARRSAEERAACGRGWLAKQTPEPAPGERDRREA